jgi:hypothetical protein
MDSLIEVMDELNNGCLDRWTWLMNSFLCVSLVKTSKKRYAAFLSSLCSIIHLILQHDTYCKTNISVELQAGIVSLIKMAWYVFVWTAFSTHSTVLAYRQNGEVDGYQWRGLLSLLSVQELTVPASHAVVWSMPGVQQPTIFLCRNMKRSLLVCCHHSCTRRTKMGGVRLVRSVSWYDSYNSVAMPSAAEQGHKDVLFPSRWPSIQHCVQVCFR